MEIFSLGEILFDYCHIDYVGPIQKSSNSYKYILFTAICDLTKFSVAIPTVDCTSLTAATCPPNGNTFCTFYMETSKLHEDSAPSVEIVY